MREALEVTKVYDGGQSTLEWWNALEGENMEMQGNVV